MQLSALCLKVLRLVTRVVGQRWRPMLFRWQGAQIGPNVRLLLKDMGSEPYLVRIDSRSLVTAGVTLLTHDGATTVFRERAPEVTRFGAIWIRENCMIGANAIILPGIIIGPNSVVGAGAVVTRDVPPDTIVAGNPARPICSVHDFEATCRAQSPVLDPGQNRARQISRICWDQLHTRAQAQAAGQAEDQPQDTPVV